MNKDNLCSSEKKRNCVILSTLLQFLDDYLRRSSSHAYSALGAVFGVDALYKLTFYLLTYIIIIYEFNSQRCRQKQKKRC